MNAPPLFFIFSHLLPIRLKRMGVSFLEDIQRLHDFEEYWDEKGLSLIGKTRLIILFNITK